MNNDLLALTKLLKKRRSIKPAFYTSEKVSEDIILEMLQNAVLAPTHGLTQPWKFFVFTDSGLIQLAEFLSTLYKNTTAAEKFNEQKFQKIKTGILKASHVILIGMQRQASEKIAEWEEMCAVACAVHNMHLTATAYHIGAYWSTGSMSTHAETKTFLGLTEKDKCLGMFFIGNYTGEIADPGRISAEEKTIWIKNERQI